MVRGGAEESPGGHRAKGVGEPGRPGECSDRRITKTLSLWRIELVSDALTLMAINSLEVSTKIFDTLQLTHWRRCDVR